MPKTKPMAAKTLNFQGTEEDTITEGQQEQVANSSLNKNEGNWILLDVRKGEGLNQIRLVEEGEGR